MTARLSRRSSGIVLLWCAVLAASPVLAQRSSGTTAPDFVFASIAQGRAVLGARDDYVRATTPLERSAKLKTADPEARFVHHMPDAPLEWSEEQRKNLAPLVDALGRFLQGIRWKMPARILLVQTNASLEEDLPHTRDNAILSPASLRITNPDTVESRHTISVRYRGRPVEALPYLRFTSGDIDPREGFRKQFQAAWLLVDRKGDACHARSGAENSVAPQDLEGLF